MRAYGFLAPQEWFANLYPQFTLTTPRSAEQCNRGSRWPLARRHAFLVSRQICHYDGGGVGVGELHCFCGHHESGRVYGLLPVPPKGTR